MGCFQSSNNGSSGQGSQEKATDDISTVQSSERRPSAIQITLNDERKAAVTDASFRTVKAGVVPHMVLRDSESIETFFSYGDSPQKLGEGMTGAVIRAVHRESGQPVAIKNVRKHMVRDIQGLLKEISILAALDHPNIVRIHSSAEDHSNVYMALELCEGGALLDELLHAKAHHFSEKAVGEMMVMMFRAIEYCHVNGVCHRDLKMDNWIFESPGGELKLIDFGLSKKFSGHGRHLAKMTSFLGTPGFVAPEMQQTHYGERNVYDQAIDIWALGVICFALISGRMPFKRKPSDCVPLEDKENRAYRRSFKKAPWPEVSGLCKDFVESLLDPNAATRPTATEALKHPWLQAASVKLGRHRSESNPRVRVHQLQSEATPTTPKLMLRLTQFARTNALQKAAMLLLAHELHQDEISELRAMFFEADSDHNGEITWEETKRVFESHGAIPDERLHHLFASHDGAHEDHVLSYSMFLAATMDHHLLKNTARLKEAFHLLDANNSGSIDLHDLVRTLETDEDETTPMSLEIKRIMSSETRNITFEEFAKLLDEFCRKSLSDFHQELHEAQQMQQQSRETSMASSAAPANSGDLEVKESQ